MNVVIRSLILLWILLSFPLTSACGQSGSLQTGLLPACMPGRYVETLVSRGVKRSYILRVPKSYDRSTRLPLVLVLHGLTGTAESAEIYTRMGELSERKGFVMVAPEGLGNEGFHGWNTGFFNLTGTNADDVAFLIAVLDRVERTVGIDPDRVFVTGHSNGAFMTHLIAARLSDRIAAIGAVAGTIGIPGVGSNNRIPKPGSPVSVLIIHGKKDAMVQYDSKSTAILHGYSAATSAKFWADADQCSTIPVVTRSANGNVTTTTYTGGKQGTEVVFVSIANGVHDWPGGVTKYGVETKTGVHAAELIWDFFLKHPKMR